MIRVVTVVAVVLGGCSRVPELEKQRAAKQAELARKTAALAALAERVAETQRLADREAARAAQATTELRTRQQAMAASWRGDQAQLEVRLRAVPSMPAALSASLQLAQTSAASGVKERKFAAALAAKDLGSLAGLVSGLEDDVPGWQAADEDEGATEEDDGPTCEPPRRTLACRRIDADAVWCPDPAEGKAWAIIDDEGRVGTVRFPGAGNASVVSRLAPRVWVLGVGSGATELLSVAEARGADFVTEWTARVMNAGAPLQSAALNLDEDPWTEALYFNQEDLTYLDPVDRDDVVVMKELAACAALERRPGTPAPVRTWCTVHRAAVSEPHTGTP